MFSGLRQNSLFYILDKSNLLLEIGEVDNVSNPMPKMNQGAFTPNGFMQQETFVDVRVKVKDTISEFKQLPSNLIVANYGNMVVSDNKESIMLEIETMQRNSKNIIESVSYHEKVLLECENMLKTLNPQFAKDKEQEEKIVRLEEKMGGIEDNLDKIMALLSEAIGHNKSKKNKEE